MRCDEFKSEWFLLKSCVTCNFLCGFGLKYGVYSISVQFEITIASCMFKLGKWNGNNRGNNSYENMLPVLEIGIQGKKKTKFI